MLKDKNMRVANKGSWTTSVRLLIILVISLMSFAAVTAQDKQAPPALEDLTLLRNPFQFQDNAALQQIIDLDLKKSATVLEGIQAVADQAGLKITYNSKLHDF